MADGRQCSPSDLDARPAGQPRRYRQVADLLAADIPSFASDRLPPVTVLAGRYGVAPQTMLKAVQLLRDRGLLRFAQGSPMRRVAGSIQSPSAGPPSLLEQDLCAAIADGTLAAGAQLQKLSSYCRDYRLSRSTVCRAVAALARRGLVHKEGRRWIAGREPPPRSSVPARRRPTVVAVIPNPAYWFFYVNHFHVAPLFWSLLGELDKYGFDLTVALSGHQPWYGGMAGGMQAVEGLVAGLGPRLRGLLLAGDRAGLPDWDAWISRFGSRGVPVVSFISDAADSAARRLLPRQPDCYRCFYDDRAAAAEAVRALAAHGHRHAAFPRNCAYADEQWIHLRSAAMVELGLAADPPLTVTVVDQDEPFWEKQRYMDQIMLKIAADPGLAQGSVAARSPVFSGYDTPRSELAAAAPSLVRIIDDPTITAIVAPNDDLAVNYLIWLQKMGRQVGRDISLLSFDNNHNHVPYPLTTIDLGFRTLGYQMAHLFIRDVPVAADRLGNVVARPHLVDRGSLATL